MADKKPLVILTRKLPDSVETRMRELFDAELNDNDEAFSREKLLEAIGRADVLVPTVTDRIDADIIASAGPKLKLIASFGTGVDHIDLKAAREAGITVTNTPGVLTEDTADVAMALILSVPRRIAEGNALIRQGGWSGWAPTGMLGHRINGKRLGIVGMGRIGQAIARRARGFGMSIHYHNRRAVHPDIEKSLEATHWDDLGQMLSRMDIVSVNCPHTQSTHHLLSREMLSRIPAQAYVVNTSRGEVIDEIALADLLEDRKIAGAGLDVYENEPEITPKLMALDNVVLLPHIGSATIEGRLSMGDKVIINIQTFVDGHTPPDRVIEVMI
ncbi:MAG: D-glycerate dehydrogenase [SAR116 cluster bacterium MED-G04]|jgi:glyoxylate reductase|nr:MAG: D-glycerate dehydrogenase [SAR116 cluster bacterium MED-G04]CAI8369796.1 MAG: Glycerate dehydrogenase [SAR116 cluster bacterium MED-G04]HCD50394.1 D-glycerate dehydrogenase [Alphaproteobacteria bacterium]HCV62916.1 D-glycerate dehydrogenase [Alphaproteobacteria bacterium]|tara:strand:- start:1090 stop:2076 length:987 start_codon:yes stop_codon:yes gene_type:complete